MTRLCRPRVQIFADFLKKYPTHFVATQGKHRSSQTEEIKNIKALTRRECRIETSFDFVNIRRIDFWCCEENVLNFAAATFCNRFLDIGKRERSFFDFYCAHKSSGSVDTFEVEDIWPKVAMSWRITAFYSGQMPALNCYNFK